MKTRKTVSNAQARAHMPVSPRPLEFPTASDAAEQVERHAAKQTASSLHGHEHTRGRAWDSEDGGIDDTDTDVLPRDRDLVDETEDRE